MKADRKDEVGCLEDSFINTLSILISTDPPKRTTLWFLWGEQLPQFLICTTLFFPILEQKQWSHTTLERDLLKL